MKTTLVCGLLGSGKTTFIKNLLRKRMEKTVVLVNDFGAAGIDGEIFSAGGIESIELPSGCVCCTLKVDLITTITRIIREFSPEHLVIEPSGVASPSGVLEALEAAGAASVFVIGIVDVTEFAELYESGMYGSFFEEQVAGSDVILVNKIDLAEKDKTLSAMSLIESINPRAILFRTVNAQLPAPLVDSVLTDGDRSRFSSTKRGKTKKTDPANHVHFETLSFRLKSAINLEDFAEFFHTLAKGGYGAAARAKALISTEAGPYRFDSVFGKVDASPFDREIKDSRLVVIGRGLDKLALEGAICGWVSENPFLIANQSK